MQNIDSLSKELHSIAKAVYEVLELYRTKGILTHYFEDEDGNLIPYEF